LRASGSVLKFDGYRKVLPSRGKQEDAELPALTEKQKLDLLDLLASQHFTQPPPRYNEASLVKTLKEKGIGRPSTYASIIKKIQDRNYVRQEHRRFFATELGMLTTDKLIKHFGDVVSYDFTSEMERELDQIEEQKFTLQKVMNDFYGPFSRALEKAKTEMEETTGVPTGENCPECGKPLVIKYSRKRQGHQFVGCSGYPECKYIKPEEGRVAPVQTDIPCPACGKPMLKRMGKTGEFLGCSGYPECKTTMNFDAEGKPVLAARPTDHVCDKCGKPMVLREGKRGPFLACSGYPKCKNAKDVDEHGNPKKEIETGVNCEKCGSPMKVQRGFRGPFLGCSNYPTCRRTKPLPEELKEKVKEMFPAAKREPTQDVDVPCPECGSSPMALRTARGNQFLGCKKYPKCRGTLKMTPEIAAKIESAATAGAPAT
jgi:DNA topoisomerase-1